MLLETYTNQQFSSAIVELSNFFMDIRANLYFEGWQYFTTEKAPEKYSDLLKWESTMVVPIANYGSDSSVYGKEINEVFRFWHDVLHITHRLDFSFNGETQVNALHMRAAKSAKISDLALKILWADTQGQTLYYRRFKKFVNNQTAFVWSVINHGIDTALTVEH